MIKHKEFTAREILRMIKNKKIVWGGNSRLKIYGRLNCYSGKRMKKENRVFFKSIDEASLLGYRPCGHCLREEYRLWKSKNKSRTTPLKVHLASFHK